MGESHGSSPDTRQTQSRHQAAAEIMPGMGQLSGEAEVKQSPRVGKESGFLIQALVRCSPEGLGAVELMGRSPGPVV